MGGGDGGVVREVLKHSCVEQVTLCEIDEVIIFCESYSEKATQYNICSFRLLLKYHK